MKAKMSEQGSVLDEDVFKNPGSEYRGVTLWMLNDKLEADETVRQIKGFREAGWGALIARSFIGLLTEYLSEEWMQILEKTIQTAKESDLKVWMQAGYMPSGIPDLTPEMTHKVLLRRAPGEPVESNEKLLSATDEEVIVQTQANHVLDLLSPAAVEDYLEKAYQKTWGERFGQEFGNTIEAMWVDEPHFLPSRLPWAEDLPDQFEKVWGYSLVDNLPSLFRTVGDFQKVRHHYWRVVAAMFQKAYFAQVEGWCEEHKVKFSGHLHSEDSLHAQIAHNGAAMPCYEYMQLPGIDHLTGSLTWPTGDKFILTPKQCSSVANQLGKSEVLCEMYGVSSQGISFEHRKRIGDWMAVLGINYRCYHGSFYSLRGRRKRQYVPNLGYQQPWWPDNQPVSDYFARLSYALRQGRYQADVLVIHPVESGFCLFESDGVKNSNDQINEPDDIKALETSIVRLSENLLAAHRGFDYGDETILSKYGTITEQGFAVGQMNYRAVILPSLITLRRSTVELLKQFIDSGGTLLSAGDLPDRVDGIQDKTIEDLLQNVTSVDNSVEALTEALKETVPLEVELASLNGCEIADVWTHVRQLDQGRLIFLTNTNPDTSAELAVKVCGAGGFESWDLRTGIPRATHQRQENGLVVTTVSLAPLASSLLFFKANQASADKAEEKQTVSRSFALSRDYQVQRETPNALTLDECRFRKGDDEWSTDLHITCIQTMLERESFVGPVTLKYCFQVAEKPQSLSVVVEDAQQYDIQVNGQRVVPAEDSHYMDRAFNPVDITGATREGENVIEMSRLFRPVPKPTSGLGALFENLVGVEFESIYLIGDFAVQGKPSQNEMESNCRRFCPDFSLTAEKKTSNGDLVGTGYPFFAGRMTLSNTIHLPARGSDERVILRMPGLDATLAKVRLNGQPAGEILWAPYEIDITSLVAEGENKVEIELVNSLRNLLGPHHSKKGDPQDTWPWQHFFFYPDWLKQPQDREKQWCGDFHVIPFGIAGEVQIEYHTTS